MFVKFPGRIRQHDFLFQAYNRVWVLLARRITLPIALMCFCTCRHQSGSCKPERLPAALKKQYMAGEGKEYIPIGSMYGIYTYICLIIVVNVGVRIYIYIPYMDPMGSE